MNLRRVLFWMALCLSTAARGRELSVLTYNAGLPCLGPACLLHDQDNARARAQGIGAWLKKKDADLVFLQEVVQTREQDVIVNASGYSYSFSPSEMTGLMVLSKFPLKDGAFERFRWQASLAIECKKLFVGWPAGIANVVVTLADGQEVDLLTTHAMARWMDVVGFADPSDALTPERLINILEMRRRLLNVEQKGRPVIFAGDFNMNQDSDEYLYFTRVTGLVDSLRSVTPAKVWEGVCTYCADNPFVLKAGGAGEKVLDFVWVAPERLSVISSKILREDTALSDHYGVLSKIRLNREKGKREVGLPSASEIDKFLAYLQLVQVSPYCWFASPSKWTQERETRWFLEAERKLIPNE